MFTKFRNLFWKNKNESNDIETRELFENSDSDSYGTRSAGEIDFGKESSELRGLDFLKSIIENEQQSQFKCQVESNMASASSLSEEVAELLKKRLTRCEELAAAKQNEIHISEQCFEHVECEEFPVGAKCENYKLFLDHSIQSNKDFQKPNKSSVLLPQDLSQISSNGDVDNRFPKIDFMQEADKLNLMEKHEPEQDDISMQDKEIIIPDTTNGGNIKEIVASLVKWEDFEPVKDKDFSADKVSENLSPENMEHACNFTEHKIKPDIIESDVKSLCETVIHIPRHVTQLELLNTENSISIFQPTESQTNTASKASSSHENSPDLSDSPKCFAQYLGKENHGHSATHVSQEHLTTNLCNNSSIVIEDLPSEITTLSPTVESTISGSSSNTSTLDSSGFSEVADPSKVIVKPIDNNGLACTAITSKLSDIAEVAESLDAIIREVQENVQTAEAESQPSSSHKKLDALRSASSEDWHSRSTEDDSFATASEGNFTPSSSSYQTASGTTTSSYISCDKNSFDASEADDSTYAFEMPEITSPLNMSLEGSEQSYLTAQPLNVDVITPDKQAISTRLEKSDTKPPNHSREEDQNSIIDIEDLHSESLTPTPEQHYDGYHVDSIPIELEYELDAAGIADAPSMEILTEHTPVPMSRTPEVSPSTPSVSSNQYPITVNVARNSYDQQELQNITTNHNNKPNAAWRRSKYYENITKQTIKGFL